MKFVPPIFLLALVLTVAGKSAEPIPAITRRIPPPGIDLPKDVRAKLTDELSKTKTRLAAVADHKLYPDAAVFVKAVELALELGEFYDTKEIPRAFDELKTANERIDHLAANKDEYPWTTARGLVVRGYRSRIDDSVQPYGLEIPEDVDLGHKVPLYVWLHGRGDKTTDLHFIQQRMTRPGQIAPKGAIVLHPFGRHCIGFKSAGEIDVLEAVDDVSMRYKIDRDRIVLMGFSMGGAGAWHLGAHYADRWVAMSAGAGFAETAQYTGLTTENYPPSYEQKLWGVYDVPGYARNLFNLPVVAYSGEIDKQIQAARVMEAAFLAHGKTLPHVIGPGMGHKYHPDSLREILRRMDEAVQKGLNRGPSTISLQTQTLRYNKINWLSVLGLQEHWRDARIDAETHASGDIAVTTQNVSSLAIVRSAYHVPRTITIDGQKLVVPDSKPAQVLVLEDKKWSWRDASKNKLEKSPGLQGPIDDAFLDRFLVVVPTGKSKNPRVQQWVEFELKHFHDRWRSLYRGEARIKNDRDVTDEDYNQNLILWGDADSNQVIRNLVGSLPLDWSDQKLTMNGKTYDASMHVPLMVYPNPSKPDRYIVLNSGPTHREGHDRTNSLQNPKLPDWAVIDVCRPPDDLAPGKIVDANFFDEAWQYKK